MTNNIFLSVIVPYHEKCGDISPGIDKLLEFLEKKPFSSELLVVSETTEILPNTPRWSPSVTVALKTVKDPEKTVMSQTESYVAGFKRARGEWAILLDADMAEFTDLIDKVINAIDIKFDLIRTYRVCFSRKSPIRKAGSWTVNTIFNAGSETKLRDIGSSLSAYRRNIYQNVFNPHFNKYHDFLPFAAVALLKKERIKEIPIKMPFSANKNSTYSIPILIRITLKMIYLKVSFSLRASA